MTIVEVIPEICCDDCNSVIHNHMETCPACNDYYASTSAYGELNIGQEFECENCGAKFKLTDWWKAEWLNESDKTENL